jgi:adenylosuccinate synthase
MRKEQCNQIKKNVFENIAPINYGKVCLNDVYRLFSHVGKIVEIEKCIDEFVKDGIAKKIETKHGKFYVFENIALEFDRKWREELEGLKKQKEQIKNTESILNEKLLTLEKMRTVWLEGWNSVLKDPDVYAGLYNYVSSLFFGQKIEKILTALKNINEKRQIINKRILELENRLKSTYEAAVL